MEIFNNNKLLVLVLILISLSQLHAGENVNLAQKAEVSGSGCYSRNYQVHYAVDGDVPRLECKNDERQAWSVNGADGMFGEFTLTWKKPVEIAEVVYFGRTGQIIQDCFKDYEIYLDDNTKPVASGAFEMRHGPQRVTIKKTFAKKLRMSFKSAHKGAVNPGASEIAVFGSSTGDAELRRVMLDNVGASDDSKKLRDKLLAGKMGFRDILLVKRHALNITHVYVYHVEGYKPGGGLYIYSADKDGGTTKCILDSSEGMITSADLSYDGKKIVFAWKKGGIEMCNPREMIEEVDRSVPENNYQIYTINIDGTGLKQLTSDQSNNLDPCWLPDGGIVFISDRKPAYAYCFVVTSPVVYRMDANGENPKRLSANYLMDFTPSVLNDGRIIYTRWEYVDRAACPIHSLWTLHPDGTGLTGYYGNRVLSPGTFMDAQSIPGTNNIIATATNHNGPCRGAIVVIDPTKGANAKESVTNLTPQVDIYRTRHQYGNGMRGPFAKPFPIDQTTYLVSKNGKLQVRSFSGDHATLLYPDSGLGYYNAQPVRQTKVPPKIVGTPRDLTAKFAEDGSSSGSWATVFVQDVYNGLIPNVKRGTIKQIAVVQEVEKSTHSPYVNVGLNGKGRRSLGVFGLQFPLVSCGATYAAKKIWGFADVKEDGSAAFKVPAEVPIYFMALDQEGRAVQRMRSFTHFMPGEVQGCVGCHADRNSAAPDMAGSPRRMTTASALTKPEWGVVGFRYDQVVQPVLDRHCIECHNERDQPADVDLTGDKTDFFNVSYDILARKGTQGEKNFMTTGSPLGPAGDTQRGESPYTSWIWSINGAGHNTLEIAPYRWGSPASKLAEIIHSGHPDKNGKPRVHIPNEERRKVYHWIDLNVPYYGTSSSNHKNRLGSRRMYPYELNKVLKEVSSRRCVQCHKDKLPRKFYTRMLKPENNSFLLAPLAKKAGGTQKCGTQIFKTKNDPDYKKIINVFAPIQKLLRENPRADMVPFETGR